MNLRCLRCRGAFEAEAAAGEEVECPRCGMPNRVPAPALPRLAAPVSSVAARREMVGLVLWSAIVGAVSGWVWGGILDPWQQEGLRAAALNLVLFGLWGGVEVLAALLVRRLWPTAGRGRYILGAALLGGVYAGAVWAVGAAVEGAAGVPPAFSSAVGFVVGSVIGGGASAVCTIKLSRLMASAAEVDVAGAGAAAAGGGRAADHEQDHDDQRHHDAGAQPGLEALEDADRHRGPHGDDDGQRAP